MAKPKIKARGLERAFAILDYLCEAGKPQRPIEICEGMQAPKSSIYELVGLLVSANVLERVDVEGRLFFGSKINYWSINYNKRKNLDSLARPILKWITDKTHETSQLCKLDGDKFYVAMMNEGTRPFRISANIGERTPIPWTASGRLLLAHLSDREILDFIPASDFALPDGSKIGKRYFLNGVHEAREAGFFDLHSVADNFTHCFAAPVYGQGDMCVCTLCIIAPKADASRHHDEYRSVLVEAGRLLSEKLATAPGIRTDTAAE